mgnify:CR=1 FL=1
MKKNQQKAATLSYDDKEKGYCKTFTILADSSPNKIAQLIKHITIGDNKQPLILTEAI